jgi:hypothetical protein
VPSTVQAQFITGPVIKVVEEPAEVDGGLLVGWLQRRLGCQLTDHRRIWASDKHSLIRLSDIQSLFQGNVVVRPELGGQREL